MNEPIILGLDDTFSFHCRKGLACFNRCCADINLFLTPYDILRIKKALQLSSRKFLDTYTTAIYMEKIGHPLVVMKMVGAEKRCPFSTPEGCHVYADRPWSCRVFPLEPRTGENSIDTSAKAAYSVVERAFCLGLRENSTQTVKQWLEKQGTGIYEKMNALWAKVTLSEKFPAQGLGTREIQMFFLASYSLDEFAQLVSGPGFLETYGLKREEIIPIVRDDLLFFAFATRWLRVTLLGEEIPLIPH